MCSLNHTAVILVYWLMVLFSFITSLTYYWHVIKCTYLKCAFWWVLMYVYPVEPSVKSRQCNHHSPKFSQDCSFKQKWVICALISNGCGESIYLSHEIGSYFTQFWRYKCVWPKTFLSSVRFDYISPLFYQNSPWFSALALDVHDRHELSHSHVPGEEFKLGFHMG